jgi:hypothetical protein
MMKKIDKILRKWGEFLEIYLGRADSEGMMMLMEFIVYNLPFETSVAA